MDRMSSKEKMIRTVLYWGLPVLAIALVIVGWVVFSAGHPDLMPAPLDVWDRFIRTFTRPIAKTTLIGLAWASLRRVLIAPGRSVLPSVFSSDGAGGREHFSAVYLR